MSIQEVIIFAVLLPRVHFQGTLAEARLPLKNNNRKYKVHSEKLLTEVFKDAVDVIIIPHLIIHLQIKY